MSWTGKGWQVSKIKSSGNGLLAMCRCLDGGQAEKKYSKPKHCVGRKVNSRPNMPQYIEKKQCFSLRPKKLDPCPKIQTFSSSNLNMISWQGKGWQVSKTNSWVTDLFAICGCLEGGHAGKENLANQYIALRQKGKLKTRLITFHSRKCQTR